jgi:hypothetical protein
MFDCLAYNQTVANAFIKTLQKPYVLPSLLCALTLVLLCMLRGALPSLP